MARAGLVTTRRDGTRIFYALASDRVAALWTALQEVAAEHVAGLQRLADAYLGSREGIVAPYEMERLVVAGQHDYETTANWKILTENYHECYHCPTIHPELCKVSPPRSGENYSAPGIWVGGNVAGRRQRRRAAARLG